MGSIDKQEKVWSMQGGAIQREPWVYVDNRCWSREVSDVLDEIESSSDWRDMQKELVLDRSQQGTMKELT